MQWLLLACSVLLGASKSILSKKVNTADGTLKGTMRSNVFLFFFAFCFSAVFAIFSVEEFRIPWALTVSYAVCVLLSQISLMKAVEYGSVAMSSLFYSCGFVIPVLFGIVYYKESFNALHVIGIILILTSFVFSVEKTQKKINAKWLCFALGGTVFSGLVGVIQKLFATQSTPYSLDLFLSAAFFCIIVVSAIVFFACTRFTPAQKPKNKSIAEENAALQSQKRKSVLFPSFVFTSALGVVMGGINKLNTYLAGILPSVVIFPATNGGVIVVSAVFSAIFFKEKLSKKQILSIIVGFIAILLIAIGQNI